MKRVSAIVVALVLVAAACGGGEDRAVPVQPTTPVAGETCVKDMPDCAVDHVGGNDAAEGPASIDVGEPNGSQPGTTSSGAVVDGGLTVPEALATDATGVLAIQGFLVSDATGIRLCQLLAESFPVQCGGASLALDATDITALGLPDSVVFTEAEGVTWTDTTVTLLGDIVDGLLVVNALAVG